MEVVEWNSMTLMSDCRQNQSFVSPPYGYHSGWTAVGAHGAGRAGLKEKRLL